MIPTRDRAGDARPIVLCALNPSNSPDILYPVRNWPSLPDELSNQLAANLREFIRDLSGGYAGAPHKSGTRLSLGVKA